jgi:L-lactate dehydrogenase complex protein LldG
MSTRQEFLGRVQKALGRQAGGPLPERLPDQLFGPLEGVMQPIPAEQIIDNFELELQKVSGCSYRAATAVELDAILRKILNDRQVRGVVCSRNPILAAVGLPTKLAAWGVTAESWPEQGANEDEQNAVKLFREKAFVAEVGITGVEFVLAESGSLVVTSRSEGAQLGSLAPPTHIALYRRSQALASLDEVLARLPVPTDLSQPMPGRSVVFITGPSRTADIEQILIRGVHGPKEVHAILVEDACLA